MVGSGRPFDSAQERQLATARISYNSCIRVHPWLTAVSQLPVLNPRRSLTTDHWPLGIVSTESDAGKGYSATCGVGVVGVVKWLFVLAVRQSLIGNLFTRTCRMAPVPAMPLSCVFRYFVF